MAKIVVKGDYNFPEIQFPCTILNYTVILKEGKTLKFCI